MAIDFEYLKKYMETPEGLKEYFRCVIKSFMVDVAEHLTIWYNIDVGSPEPVLFLVLVIYRGKEEDRLDMVVLTHERNEDYGKPSVVRNIEPEKLIEHLMSIEADSQLERLCVKKC